MEVLLVTTVGSPFLWVGFLVFVCAMLALDLGVFQRKAHAPSVKEALTWSGVWVALAGLFGTGLYFWAGPTAALEFATGYVVEKALAIDNIFVFVVIFAAFAVPAALQHRVLFWGVLGALVLRAGFIFAGAALLHAFEGILYVFGAILIATAAKLAFGKSDHADPKENALYRAFRRFVPATEDYRGERFFVKENGRRLATPLFAVLLLIEATDVIFAVDSIPAIFAITRDPFLVFTSNIFAILGLRSMFFLLADVVHRFHYLKPGLAAILGFVGAKLLGHGFVKVPVGVSLGVILGILAISVIASIAFPKPAPAPAPAPAPIA